MKKAAGYQFKIALNKKMTKSPKAKSTKKRSVTFRNLKPGKKYYVKVRAYDKKHRYGKWSSAKTVRVKKAAPAKSPKIVAVDTDIDANTNTTTTDESPDASASLTPVHLHTYVIDEENQRYCNEQADYYDGQYQAALLRYQSLLTSGPGIYNPALARTDPTYTSRYNAAKNEYARNVTLAKAQVTSNYKLAKEWREKAESRYICSSCGSVKEEQTATTE